jgi:hypothetical protein
VISSVLLVVCAVACVEDFSEQLSVHDGAVGFELVSHRAGDLLHVTNPTFTFEFGDYLDARTSDMVRAFTLEAGVHRPRLVATWDVVRRSLDVQPLDSLRGGLTYTLSVEVEFLRGLGSRPVNSQLATWFFPVDSDAAALPEIAVEAVGYSQHIRPILVESCGCHWEPQRALTPLDPVTLAGRADQRRGRSLVVPFDPGRSYLMEKLLDAYPDRFGTQMPPPWAEEAPLSGAEMQLVHAWISGGALDPD